ncbi:MAG: ABC transporter permease [Candidatus Bipolaricaulota bacterium]
MIGYLVRRFAQVVVVAFLVSIMVFFVIRMMPGDPARLLAGMEATQEQLELVREKYGLNEPLFVQYQIFLTKSLQGDLGQSLNYREPVIQLLWRRFKNSLQLIVFGLGLAFATGITFGVIAGVKDRTVFDYFTMGAAVVGVSLPQFWLGLMLMLLFSVQLGWLPTSGSGSFRHLVLPSLTIAITYIAINARVTRSSMLDVLSEDYVTTARSKGLREWKVLIKHALRNALIPIVTIMGLQIGGMLMGLVVVETVFSWPGVGRLLIDSIGYRDYPVMQAVMIYGTVGVLMVNFLVDVAYAFIDPRIQYR